MKQEIKPITLTYPWDENGYCPEVTFYPKMTEQGFYMKIIAKEQNPKRDMTEHFQYVHKDSCVEWFANFSPKTSNRYFNFEVNANGVMNVSFRENRKNFVKLTVEDVEQFHIQAKVDETQWSVEYLIPFSLMEKYYEGFERKKEMEILTNFYKCGDGMEFPHYGVWNPIDLPKPDFHQPEYFGKLTFRME